jgi:hypothetical protein
MKREHYFGSKLISDTDLDVYQAICYVFGASPHGCFRAFLEFEAIPLLIIVPSLPLSGKSTTTLTVHEMRTCISTFQYSVSHNALILSVISLDSECRNFKRSTRPHTVICGRHEESSFKPPTTRNHESNVPRRSWGIPPKPQIRPSGD